MEIFCERFVKHHLPAVRSMIAKRLLERHELTQNEAAKKMKTSQPAISHYIREARGKKVKELESNEELVKKIDEVVEKIYKENLDDKEFEKLFCEICKLILGDPPCLG